MDKKWFKKYSKEWKKFMPKFKKMHRKLIKRAKQFHVFDYEYMLSLIYQSIIMYYEFFKNTNLLVQDTTDSKFSKYNEIISSLTQCYEIVKRLDEDFSDTSCDKYEYHLDSRQLLIKQLFKIMSENIFGWWD